MINLSYKMDHILYQIFKNSNTQLAKHDEKIDNLPIRIYVNKIENKITFKIKLGHYFELLTPETIKLLGSTKTKTTKAKMGRVYHIVKLKKLY